MTNPAKITRRFALVLLGGFVVATCVAWACALWSPDHWVRPPSVNGVWIGTERLTTFGYRGEVVLYARGFEDDIIKEWAQRGESEFGAGWPKRMLVSHVKPHSVRDRALSGFELPIGELLGRGYPTDRLPRFLRACADRRIPIVPLWEGLAFNVLVWSVPVYGITVVWPTLHLRFRRRSHLCAVCGYDLAGLAVDRFVACPECGTPLPRDNGTAANLATQDALF